MANESLNTTGQTEEVRSNKLTFEDQVIKKIAGIASNEVQGILSMSGGFMSGLTDRLRSTEDITKGVGAEVGERQVALDLRVIVEYGKNIPSIFQETVAKIKKAIGDMTGLEVVEVNMHVEDVMTRAEFDAKSKNEQAEEKTSREIK